MSHTRSVWCAHHRHHAPEKRSGGSEEGGPMTSSSSSSSSAAEGAGGDLRGGTLLLAGARRGGGCGGGRGGGGGRGRILGASEGDVASCASPRPCGRRKGQEVPSSLFQRYRYPFRALEARKGIDTVGENNANHAKKQRSQQRRALLKCGGAREPPADVSGFMGPRASIRSRGSIRVDLGEHQTRQQEPLPAGHVWQR